MRTPAAAASVGITFTVQDNTDIVNGLTATSFRTDAVHLNLTGRRAVAYRLTQELVSRSWAIGYGPAILTYTPTVRWDLTRLPVGANVASVAPITGTTTLTQGTAGSQPTMVADAAFRHPVMQGEGKNVCGVLPGTPTAFSVTALMRFTDKVASLGDAFMPFAGVNIRDNGGKWATFFTAGGASMSSTINTDTLPHALTVAINGVASAIWVNGVKVATGTAAVATVTPESATLRQPNSRK